ncbi:MAG: hypothetical protein ACIAQU_04150 [Phycisphaerales bacterium JB064]
MPEQNDERAVEYIKRLCLEDVRQKIRLCEQEKMPEVYERNARNLEQALTTALAWKPERDALREEVENADWLIHHLVYGHETMTSKQLERLAVEHLERDAALPKPADGAGEVEGGA